MSSEEVSLVEPLRGKDQFGWLFKLPLLRYVRSTYNRITSYRFLDFIILHLFAVLFVFNLLLYGTILELEGLSCYVCLKRRVDIEVGLKHANRIRLGIRANSPGNLRKSVYSHFFAYDIQTVYLG